MVELIVKKRDGMALNREELTAMIQGYISGDIPDYQMSSFLMAVYFNGMTDEETAVLTDLMMRSGDLIDLSDIPGVKVDKHSTGGVGDKTTLVLAPLVAAAGVPVAKMSGRGLGHTGGTLDKMESFAGLSVDMTREAFIDRVKTHQIALCGQNADLVPADKQLYALRDVTGTVNNSSLIASSIMSKKLACGADAIVIDIKVGEGAFMKNVAEAEELGRIMIEIGAKMNRRVVAVATDMDQPLGYAVGNALEVREAIDTLNGGGPDDLRDLCLELGSHMLVLGGVAADREDGIAQLEALIQSGKGFEKFKELIQSQGGDIRAANNPELLPTCEYRHSYRSKADGYIAGLDALDVGLASVRLGAGRETKASAIDHGAGVLLRKKVGDPVKKDEELAVLYSNNDSNFTKAISIMDKAFKITAEKPGDKPLILKVLS